MILDKKQTISGIVLYIYKKKVAGQFFLKDLIFFFYSSDYNYFLYELKKYILIVVYYLK